MRRPIFDSVHGFDENYFMYGEECEMLYRIHLKYPQYQTWYLVGPQIIHLGNASASNKIDPLIKEYEGVVSFFSKHKPSWQTGIIKKFIKINALSHQFLYFLTGNSSKKLLYQQICSKTLNY
jgi:GT2 family glycosyltransferase